MISSAASLLAAGFNPWAWAAAQPVAFGTTIDTGVGLATNPYNEANSRGASAAASLDVRPDFTIRGENSELKVEGLVHLRQFASNYGLEDNYGLNARWSRRATDGLTLRAHAGVVYSKSGFNAILPAFAYGGIVSGDGSGGDLGGLTPIGPIGGIELINGGNRITAFDAAIGADYRLNASDAVSSDAQFRTLRSKRAGFSDYDFASQELRYSHIFNERTTVGAIGQVAATHYVAARGGDARTLSLLGGVVHRLNSRLVVDLSAGLARTNIREGLLTPGSSFTSLALRGSVCDTTERGRLCLEVRQNPQPTSNGGVRNAGTIGIDFTRRLSFRDQISANAGYSRTGPTRVGAVALRSIGYFGFNGRFERRFTESMSGFVSGSYQSIHDSQISQRADLGFNIGLRVRFGRAK